MAVVYFHKRLDTNEVFYVGIGKTIARAKSKNSRSEFWWNIVNKVGYIIEVVHNKISWREAIDLETKYIGDFGRRDLGLGPLVNLTNGGEGNIGWIPSEIVKNKIGNSNRGKKRTDEYKKRVSIRNKGKNNPMYGKPGFEGKVFTKVSLSNLSHKGSKHYSTNLTEQDIIDIRINKDSLTHLELAKKYGKKRPTITNIINNVSWKHVKV
ncbi:NUMOD3 domain-containing DNA-binding protein [bacterium]|nr:NUMOD3 domain-containing DNA-binding protein [bacterium]